MSSIDNHHTRKDIERESLASKFSGRSVATQASRSKFSSIYGETKKSQDMKKKKFAVIS